jgi:hypothetical protein
MLVRSVGLIFGLVIAVGQRPLLFEELPFTVKRQIELWQIEHQEDKKRWCMPGKLADRCHNLSESL